MTIHRALGYVERASLADGGPLRVVMASEGKQADGIDLRMSGVDLGRFNRNPVLGYGHRYWSREDLPIGRVDNVKVAGKELSGDLVFDDGDRAAARALVDDLTAEFGAERVLAALLRHGLPGPSTERPAPPVQDPTPAAPAGVDPDAARALLAAFAKES